MPRRSMPDVIVLLPGITGSVLQKDGKDAWALTAEAGIRALRSLCESIQDLKLEDDPPHIDDLGDGVRAPRVMSDAHLLPGLWKIDGYTKVSRRIAQLFDVTEDRNFFQFPYDWRRDNSDVGAGRIHQSVGEVCRHGEPAHLIELGGASGRTVSPSLTPAVIPRAHRPPRRG
ncbi:MAG: hypothetical protein ACRDSL_12570 [Pseudonocardiaceae bacterium]